jgi:hypothetical protein
MANQLVDGNGRVIPGAILSTDDIGTSGVVAVGTTSAATAVISTTKSVLVRLACSVGHCHFAIATSPTATITASPMLVNNSVEYVQLKANERLAFIRDAAVTAATVSWTVVD